MLDDKTISALRLLLEEDLVRLEADVAELDRHERESQSEASGENVYRDHMADQGSATFERELDMTFEENERDLLNDVRAALVRLDAETYGICARCSAEIPAARLEAVPTASLCIKCKEAEETR
jgi:DnaK suppressor protein